MTFPNAAITTTDLGYGCSQVMARAGRRRSVRLIETAFEAGIAHFDTARSYGYGEAEGALGTFLERHRDEVTITTKLGLAPPRGSRALRAAKPAARAAVTVLPQLRRVVRRQAARTVSSGRFSVPDARASVEASLRELRTDHVDLLLLHECRPEDLTDELLGFLHECVEQGRARAFGIATRPPASPAIVAEFPEFARVVQVANGLMNPDLDDLPDLGESAIITHSALSGLDIIRRHVAASAERRRRWADAVGADCSDPGVLGGLLLVWARLANPDGIVLFSSRDPRHIRANATGAPGPSDRDRAQRLAALVRRELLAQPPSISSTSGAGPS